LNDDTLRAWHLFVHFSLYLNFNNKNMETPKEFETPKGLNDCTLTDINLLREWLANVCDPRQQKLEVPRGLNDCTLTDINLLREWLSKTVGAREIESKKRLASLIDILASTHDDRDAIYEEAAYEEAA
jgi:hypothetical protein